MAKEILDPKTGDRYVQNPDGRWFTKTNDPSTNGKLANPPAELIAQAQEGVAANFSPEQFRYGNFSPTAEKDMGRYQHYTDLLRWQEAPTVGPTAYRHAEIDPALSQRSNESLNEAQGVGQRQGAFLDTLKGAAEGGAPSVAQQQLQAGQASAARDAMSIANSARGGAGNSVAAVRAALRSQGAGAQTTNAQTAMLRADEMARARGEYGAAMGQKRAQDLGTSSTAFGQGLQTGQFGAQQNQFESGLRADEAKTNATLEAGQRELALRGTLGYGEQGFRIGQSDMIGREARAEMMSQRDLAERGLGFQQAQFAAQQRQQQRDNTKEDVGMIANAAAPVLSDIRNKKDVAPADSDSGKLSKILAGIGKGARGKADEKDDKNGFAYGTPWLMSKEEQGPVTVASPSNPNGFSDGLYRDPAILEQEVAAKKAAAGVPPAAAAPAGGQLPDPYATEAWAAQYPLRGAPQLTNTWALQSGLNVPPPANVLPAQYALSDTEAKKDAVRADTVREMERGKYGPPTQDAMQRRLDALEARVSGQPETTAIPPGRQAEFDQWVKQRGIRDLDHPDSHYDYRGAFMAGEKAGPDAHWHDTYKQHGHPTFSNESQYARPTGKDFGYWEGDKFVAPLPPADLDASYARQGADVGPRYVSSDTAAKRDAVRAGAVGDAEHRLAALEARVAGNPDMARMGEAAGRGLAVGGASAPAIDLRPAKGFWYNYKDPRAPGADDGRHLGPMAQDLEKTPAGASVVKTGPDGKKVVDAGRLALVNTSAIAEGQRRDDTAQARLDALEARIDGRVPGESSGGESVPSSVIGWHQYNPTGIDAMQSSRYFLPTQAEADAAAEAELARREAESVRAAGRASGRPRAFQYGGPGFRYGEAAP